MTLQNRVNPWGEILAVPQRGTMMGNRGGKFHRDDRTLSKRRWASRHWICCDLDYKGAHHEAMGKGYTSLFFLDEVTALAAGHRPCFFCRGKDAKRFLGDGRVDGFDRQVHGERLASALPGLRLERDDLPDGAMAEIDGEAYAMKAEHLLHWSFDGYTHAVPRKSSMHARLLTPPSIVSILRAGYEPRWHESALQGGYE